MGDLTGFRWRQISRLSLPSTIPTGSWLLPKARKELPDHQVRKGPPELQDQSAQLAHRGQSERRGRKDSWVRLGLLVLQGHKAAPDPRARSASPIGERGRQASPIKPMKP